MPIEAALIKPVVDALMGLFRRGENLHLKHNAEAALREAIRELLLANPDENKAEARIAIAKAAGILSGTWCWPKTCCASIARPRRAPRGKSGSSRARKTAAKPDNEAGRQACQQDRTKPAAQEAREEMTASHLFSALCLVWAISQLWIGRRRSGDAARARDRGTLNLLIVAIFAALAFGIWLAWRDDGQLATRNVPLLWSGMATMVAGLLLRWWSVRTLAQYFTVDIAIQPGQELIRRGPYRLLRHPSYTGALLHRVRLRHRAWAIRSRRWW